MSDCCIAHVREYDKKEQTVAEHLLNVAEICKINSDKVGLGRVGELVGLLHDLGKYSYQFQAYIKSATGLLDQDSDGFVDAGSLKGTIDHSSAGAQFVWKKLLQQNETENNIIAQVIAISLISHHSGIVDCISPAGKDLFHKRMRKADAETNFYEARNKCDPRIMKRVETILSDPLLIREMKDCLTNIVAMERSNALHTESTESQISRIRLKIGFLLRILFSCLIDADRTDTIDFENPKSARLRQRGVYTPWEVLTERFESYLRDFKIKSPIDEYRKEISLSCLKASYRDKGLFTLEVPTGGGKTLASLRFALNHSINCKKKGQSIDRILYIIPYTSIIDQNANVARTILELQDTNDQGSVVLEHHSNLTSDKETWRGKILSENWDAPIVFTTNVQFLETLFGSGTRGARRMHQLINSVIIFDEIQTLPIRCIHLFCNAVNFLINKCGCTVVLCTATQPLLGEVDRSKGSLHISSENKMISDTSTLFKQLKRVEIIDRRKRGGWNDEEIALLAMGELRRSGSCLVIANTTKSARNLYKLASNRKEDQEQVYHLSANMCPAHRMKILHEIRQGLDSTAPKRVLCISTQVIETGVDVDFGSVIRFMAGLDSIAQAAGRCNRNGRKEVGWVYIVNSADENLNKLVDIRCGQDATMRVLDEIKSHPEMYGSDLLDPQSMTRYFEYYFFARKGEMNYPVKPGSVPGLDRDDNLLELLSTNKEAVSEYVRCNAQKPPNIYLRQSFATAAEAFKSIDSPTRGVIVPYGEEGRSIIADLCSADGLGKALHLLRKAQHYSVNVYPYLIEKLKQEGALFEPQAQSGLLCLDERYYSDEFGISDAPVKALDFMIVEGRD